MFAVGSPSASEAAGGSDSARSPGGGGGSGAALQFREASDPMPELEFHEAGAEADDGELRFRPASGEESSSVVLVHAAPNAPDRKRGRDDADAHSEGGAAKRRREEDAFPGAQIATSERVLSNEDEIDDAFADAFGENDDEGEQPRTGSAAEGRSADGKDGSGAKSQKVDADDDDDVQLVHSSKVKVLNAGEIDDALDDAFAEDDGGEEPEDVALPTGPDLVEESAPKDGTQDAVMVEKDAAQVLTSQNVNGVPVRPETKSYSEPVDEITRLEKRKTAEKGSGTADIEKNATDIEKVKIDSNDIVEASLPNGTRGDETVARKDEAKDLAKIEDVASAKEESKPSAPAGDSSKSSPVKKNSPKKGKGVEGGNDSKVKKQPEDIPNGDEEAPLDLAAMSAFEYEQVAKLNPVQLRRYEQYRRSDLKNGKVKKILVNLNPSLQKASEQYIIAVKGLSKLFVGDVVECAIEVKKQMGEKGALQPKHLREAYRRLRRSGVIPSTNDKSASFS